MKIINIFFLTLILPIALFVAGGAYALNKNISLVELPAEKLNPSLVAIEAETQNTIEKATKIKGSVELEEQKYQEQKEILAGLADKSYDQTKLSNEVYEKMIIDRLGKPIDGYHSNRVDIKVFSLKGLGYRGYMAKVKLYDSKAFKVALGKDKLGESETTSAAVKRYDAIFGVNGGGFYQSTLNGQNCNVPISNTVIDSKLINGFSPSYKNLFFAGVDSSGELIGGEFFKKDELMKLKPVAGVSFVPSLIKNRKPLPIPKQWANQKQPRTIIGEYGNDDLLFIVVDGRQADWSSGVTLEQLQIKLIDFGVIEAYNLDGGGSSTFVSKGRVLNKPSDGKERPVTTNILIMP